MYIRERGNGKEFIANTALSFSKVAPILQEKAQHVYLPEGHPKISQRELLSSQEYEEYTMPIRECAVLKTLKAGAHRAEIPVI